MVNKNRKKFLVDIKNILIDKKSNIIDKLSYADNNIDAGSADEIDIIQAKIIAHTNAQLAARDKEKISKIDLALKKISDGTFGYCEECSEQIPEKRLLFNPIFITCVDCAEHLEKISKRNTR